MNNSLKTANTWEDSNSELLDAIEELSIKTADSFSPDASYVSDSGDDGWHNADKSSNTAVEYKVGTQNKGDIPQRQSKVSWSESTYLRSSLSGMSTETAKDNVSKDPPSYYQLPEMNKKQIKHITRLAPCPSQYHLAEMRDYQALQANSYMLKLATSMCVRDNA